MYQVIDMECDSEEEDAEGVVEEVSGQIIISSPSSFLVSVRQQKREGVSDRISGRLLQLCYLKRFIG